MHYRDLGRISTLGPTSRLFARTEASTSLQKKKTLSWLLRGYINGGHLENAAETVIKMLDLGLCPDFLDRAAVLWRLRRTIQQSGSLEIYLNLCKHLSDAILIGPCLNWVAMIQDSRLRLKGWQQAAVALGSAVGALLDPRRADLIAALGETMGKPAFDRVLERMKKSPEGRSTSFEDLSLPPYSVLVANEDMNCHNSVDQNQLVSDK
ncbi:hypothetical protein RND71_023597 [Anisodus tanguticus]|uniref:Pentatricopeptide repeat-containing protein n=1 Tax=Anisodus tanguticus TaxID=243964 RepID=A0AAE1RV53_9SOLA|nr:hypothetical protein RND71_023597 [Anisodus tanguticus]